MIVKLRRLKIRCSLWLFFSLLLITNTLFTQSEEPAIPIATTNHPLATAHNNGRRLVRDSFDHRYVVYQDLNGLLPIVCFCKSHDGKTWTRADTLAEGAFPSLAIDAFDRLYLVWQAVNRAQILFTYSTDSGENWKLPPASISYSDTGLAQFPVIEASASQLHIAWQQGIENQQYQWREQIFYTAIALDSLESELKPPIDISSSANDAKFPTIANNLSFWEGSLHVVWYDSLTENNRQAMSIMYRALNEQNNQWEPALNQAAYHLSMENDSAAVHPAISVEWGGQVHVVWGNKYKKNIHHLTFMPENLATATPSLADFPAESYICLDDPRVLMVPIIWMQNNEIYYTEIINEFPINPSSFILSLADSIKSSYPSVAYKQMNIDFFDVLWLEGNRAPYQILYQRTKKTSFGAVKEGKGNTQSFGLKQNYPNPLNPATEISYTLPDGIASYHVTIKIYDVLGRLVKVLVDAEETAGSHSVRWDSTDLQEQPVASGVYFYSLEVGEFKEMKKMVLLR